MTRVREVTEEWDEWGRRGDSPGAHRRTVHSVEVSVEMSDGRVVAGGGEADSRGVARAEAWEEVMDEVCAHYSAEGDDA